MCKHYMCDKIEKMIGEGEEEAVSREIISLVTGLKDRTVRACIEDLRKETKDYVIVSSSHTRGYYKTRDPEEIRGFIKEQTGRVKAIFCNLKNASRLLKAYDSNAGCELNFDKVIEILEKF